MDIIKLKEALFSLKGNETAIVYLGGAGFLISHKGTTVLVDPYLSYSVDRAVGGRSWERLYAPPFSPEELSFADAVCVSHDHLDHADPDTIAPIAAANGETVFVCSRAIENAVRSYGAKKTAALRRGETIGVGSVSVTVIPAAHEEVKTDKNGDCEACGFIFDVGGIKIYHSGDSLVYDGLSEKVFGADVMLLPVNGNGFFRRADNIVGNMDAYDAARLAAFCRARFLIPMHFDLYRGNYVPPEAVKAIVSAAAPSLSFALPVPGEGFLVNADGVFEFK